MEVIIAIALIGMGITIGMYIASQISQSIKNNTNEKLLRNMNEYDKNNTTDINNNNSHYYTHIKKGEK
tara:strand:+ start:13239 stop:13442 length:204 start_codon:yes stop_codon:yes gene_type:complete